MDTLVDEVIRQVCHAAHDLSGIHQHPAETTRVGSSSIGLSITLATQVTTMASRDAMTSTRHRPALRQLS